MDLGSVWDHGTIRGPDFSAQSLHMMGQEMRNYYAMELNKMPYTQLEGQHSENYNERIRDNPETANSLLGLEFSTFSIPKIGENVSDDAYFIKPFSSYLIFGIIVAASYHRRVAL